MATHRLTALAVLDPDRARAEILEALTTARGEVAGAARALGISRRGWYHHCARLGISPAGTGRGRRA